MTSDEIKEMFLASAMLRHCPETDARHPLLEDAVEQLSHQYRTECLTLQNIVQQKEKMSLQEAFDILVKTCQSATSLELEHHPDGMSDEQVQTLVNVRKMALDRVVEEVKKS